MLLGAGPEAMLKKSAVTYEEALVVSHSMRESYDVLRLAMDGDRRTEAMSRFYYDVALSTSPSVSTSSARTQKSDSY